MTLRIAPAPASTSSGAALPLVALPQTELLTVNEKTSRWCGTRWPKACTTSSASRAPVKDPRK